MKPLAPIPTPLNLRWREFRIKLLPSLVFTGVLSLALLIWVEHVTPPTIVGQVEAVQAAVRSTRAGTLAQLQVGLFKKVRAGEPVATVITTDPRVLESSLAVIQAEVQLIRVGMAPVLDRGRNELSFERMRVDSLAQRVQLALMRVRLQYAEGELRRVAGLYQQQTNLVSKADYDIAVRDRDAVQAEVAAQSRLVEEMEKSLQGTALYDPARPGSKPEEALQAAIAVQEKRLKLTEAELSPITLQAPIGGMVSMVYRRSGENVVPGEPVVTITSTQPEKIVAYLVQPTSAEPQVGAEVRVTTRALRRVSGLAKVREVGAFMTPVPPVLLPPSTAQVVQLGVPVDVSIPVGLKVRVGEIVDLSFL